MTGWNSPTRPITAKNRAPCPLGWSATGGRVRCAGRLARPHLGGDWYVLGFDGRKFPAAIQALAVARAARSALLAHGEQPSPEILSGHQPQSGGSGPTPPTKRTHLAVVPLLNAGNAHSDGTIFGIAFVLPADCSPKERHVGRAGTACVGRGRRVRRIQAGCFRAGKAGHASPVPSCRNSAWTAAASLSLTGSPLLTSRRKTTTRDYWCRPARRWLTVTPIALDRFPGNLRSTQPEARDRAAAEAAAGIVQACVNAGLAADPSDVKRSPSG